MSATDDPRTGLPTEITLSLREARLVVSAIAGALGEEPSLYDLQRAARLLASKLWPVLGGSKSAGAGARDQPFS